MIFEIIIPLILFLAGWFIGSKVFHKSGVLIIDESDEEVDRWTLEIHVPIDSIRKKKSIKLKIERR